MTDTSPLAAPPTWVDADTRTRDAAKWMIGALGAVAVAVFGAGPIVAGLKLSWSEDWRQLLVAAGFGIIGLAAIGLLIVAIGSMLVPVVVSIATLSKDTVAVAEHAQRDELLPSGITTVNGLRSEIASSSALLRDLDESAEYWRSQGDHAAADSADQQHTTVSTYLVTLEKYALQLQEYDAFARIRDGFLKPYGHSAWLYILVLGAAVGSLGFILAISPKPYAASGPQVPIVGTLSEIPSSAASVDLWTQLKLGDCASDPTALTIPVLILKSQGSAAYTVQTLPSGTCTVRTFDVTSALAVVAKPTSQDVVISTVQTSVQRA